MFRIISNAIGQHGICADDTDRTISVFCQPYGDPGTRNAAQDFSQATEICEKLNNGMTVEAAAVYFAYIQAADRYNRVMMSGHRAGSVPTRDEYRKRGAEWRKVEAYN